MDDALLVRRFQRLRDLPGDGQRFVERDRATRDALRQVLALDQLHHERGDAAAFFEAVDRRRCADDSATRGLRLRAESARAVVVALRTTAGRILIATWRFSFVSVAR